MSAVGRGMLSSLMVLITIGPARTEAQDLGDRVGAVDGRVTFHYKGRDGLEGCGDGNISFDGGNWYRGERNRSPEDCGEGPVLIVLDVDGEEVYDLDVRVGPRVHLDYRGDHDLGRIAAPEAASYLLEVARTARRRVAEDAIFPAFIADSATVWPDLIELARDSGRPDDVRSSALFWVGQEAAGVATEGLAQVARDEDEDQRIREAAVFALSQRPEEEGVPILMDVARTADDAETRRSAMFWLAQSDDPGVLDFFEEVLLGRQ